MNHKYYMRKAFIHSMPVFSAYVPLGAVWGFLWEQQSFPPLIGILFSTFVFAGVVQFLALSFIVTAEPLFGVILTALPIAMRNTFYTISMLDRLPKRFIERTYSAFSLVDATFAILSSQDKSLSTKRSYSLTLSILVHIYWILGTTIGVLSGGFVPDGLKSLDFALPTLIAILAYDNLVKIKSFKPLIIACIAFVIAYVLFGSSWLLPALAICAIVAVSSPNKEPSCAR